MTHLIELIVASVLSGSTVAALALWRVNLQRAEDKQRRTVRMQFPKDIRPEQVVAFARALSTLPSGGWAKPSIAFELHARGGRLEHRLRIPKRVADELLMQLRTAIPGLIVEAMDDETFDISAAAEYRLHGAQPLRTDEPQSTAAAILAGVRSTAERDGIVWQLVVRPERRQVRMSPLEPTSNQLSLGQITRLRSPAAKPSLSATDTKAKLSEPLLVGVLRVGASAANSGVARARIERVASLLHLVDRPHARFVRRAMPDAIAAGHLRDARTPTFETPVTLNAREVATLIAWPIGDATVAGLERTLGRRLEPSAKIRAIGRVLGDSDAPGVDRPIALSVADSLQHTHVVGPTGVGKTTLLAGLALQDIAAGRSTVVIDRKGDLVGAIIDRLKTTPRDDVVILDPADDERPVGFNLLEGSGSARELVADLVVGMFHRLYAAFWGPRTAYILHAGVLTLTEEPGATLCELAHLLTSDAYRRRLTGRIRDPYLAGFWTWFEAMSVAERAAVLGPIMNKLGPLLLRKRVRHLLAQSEATWSLDDILNRGGVLLINLARGELGDEASSLIGALVVARLWQVIQARAIRLPAMVYIDEFQDVVKLPTDLGEVLAQARGFGVGLTLAHQHLAQLDPATRTAVAANARSKVGFQTGPADARTLAAQLGGALQPEDLTVLPRHHAYATLCVDGAVAPPVSLRTRPLPPAKGSAAEVRQRSRERYGRNAVEVEAALLARLNVTSKTPDQLGRKRRGESS